MFRIINVSLIFAVLAWGQDSSVSIPADAKPGEVYTAEGSQTKQIAALKQEVERLTHLLNWYQQQFFALQARQIEQQIAPKEPTRAAKPPAQGEPAK